MVAKQRKLGAIEGELVSSPNLPATLNPSNVATFEGWDSKDLLNWLRDATAKLEAVERWTEENRLMIGAALYTLRDQVGEGQYGAVEAELAKTAGVSERSLRRWRAAYEATRELPPPKKAEARTEAQRRRREEELRPPVLSSPASPVPSGDTLQREDQPAVDQAVSTAAAIESGISPSADGSGNSRGAQRPAGRDTNGTSPKAPKTDEPSQQSKSSSVVALRKALDMLATASVEELKEAGPIRVRDAVDRLAQADGRALITHAELLELRKSKQRTAELQEIITKLESPSPAARRRSLERPQVTPNFKGAKR